MTYTKTIFSCYSFPKYFGKSLMLFFLLYATKTLYAQTVVTGMEYITINDGAVIYIQNDKEADGNGVEKMISNADGERCSAENKNIPCEKSSIKEKLFKKRIKSDQLSEDKDKIVDKIADYQEVKIEDSPCQSDSSFSVSSGKTFLACSVYFQLKAAGIAEKTYFILYNVRDVSRIFLNNGISFPDKTSSYHSGRAPPYYC